MPNSDITEDWRYRTAAPDLRGQTLWKERWRAPRPSWDHDHCEFCWAKFSESIEGALREGYVTAGGREWVCPACFADFRDAFDFTLGTGPRPQTDS